MNEVQNPSEGMKRDALDIESYTIITRTDVREKNSDEKEERITEISEWNTERKSRKTKNNQEQRA